MISPTPRVALAEDVAERVAPEAGRLRAGGGLEQDVGGGGRRSSCGRSLGRSLRVEEGVADVDDRLTTRNDDRDHEREALDHGEVARRDRLVDGPADAGQVEDRLGQDGAARAGRRAAGR